MKRVFPTIASCLTLVLTGCSTIRHAIQLRNEERSSVPKGHIVEHALFRARVPDDMLFLQRDYPSAGAISLRYRDMFAYHDGPYFIVPTDRVTDSYPSLETAWHALALQPLQQRLRGEFVLLKQESQTLRGMPALYCEFYKEGATKKEPGPAGLTVIREVDPYACYASIFLQTQHHYLWIGTLDPLHSEDVDKGTFMLDRTRRKFQTFIEGIEITPNPP